ncbi:protein HEG-like isoform X3 [Anguilla rostrata]|uniref:protein HEG-like isoform X3 n=1 Tax=Anguilla rostrata TaxID=7938 RepID=UPI0030D458CF
MEADTTLDHSPVPLTTPENNSTTPVTTNSTTMEADTTLDHSPVPLTTPENNSTTPVTTNFTTMEADTTLDHSPVPSTTPVNNLTTPVTTNFTTMEADTTLDHSPVPSTTPVTDTTLHHSPVPSTTPVNNLTTPVTINETTMETTAPSTSGSTTPTGGPTAANISSSTPSTAPNSSASTPATGFCFSNPCPFDSICEELFMSFRCLCLPGSFYSSTERSCVQARVFPGRLRLTSLQFQDEMANTSSPIFLRTSQNISRTLEESLRGQPGYVRSTVLQLSRGSVVATVDNVFSLASNATQATANAAIMEAIQGCGENCILKGAEFNGTDLCSQVPGPCDTMTTSCNLSGGIPACTCKPGHLKTLYSNKSCTACPSGSKAEDGKCVACPFGYAGFNCNDSSLLAVVVISCVLGGVLLILLLAFIISCCCRKKKDPTYSSPYPAEDAGPTSSWSNRQIIPIPRASLHWDSSQMELTENRNAGRKSHGNGSTGSYDVSKVNLSTFKDENPARYSYLAQGHENPYFLAEDERKGK